MDRLTALFNAVTIGAVVTMLLATVFRLPYVTFILFSIVVWTGLVYHYLTKEPERKNHDEKDTDL
jgi:type III secretory pathway component EscV